MVFFSFCCYASLFISDFVDLDTVSVPSNYRLDDENPVRIEILYNYTKLLSRIDLSYNPLN